MAGAEKEQPGMSENGPRVGHASGQTCANTKGTRARSHHGSGAAASLGMEMALYICHLPPAQQWEGCREAAGAECDLLFL